VKAGQLREDLYYRLNVFPIHLAPLRGRAEDIELLADHFLAELNRGSEAPKHWSRAALQRLRESSWTGNVRELRNVVQRAYILGDEEIGAEALPLAPAAPPVAVGESSSIRIKVGTKIADAERALILATLQSLGDDKKLTAQTLGLSLKTLYNRLNIYAASGLIAPKGAPKDARPAAIVPPLPEAD